MVAWSLRICFRLRVCGRLPLSIRPTKLRKLRSLFASASVLLWPVLWIDGKANICLEESLLFVSGIIQLFPPFLRSPILLSYRRVQSFLAVSPRLEKVSFLFFSSSWQQEDCCR
jgi:hypothetical protein